MFGMVILLSATCSKKTTPPPVVESPIPKIEDSLPIETILKTDTIEEPIEYYNPDFLRYENYIYRPHIKTVLFHRKDVELSDPLLELNDPQPLLFAFDDLDANYKDYYYTVIHCDIQWQPSDLEPYEYMEGFEENPIRQYRFSFNTIQSYIHYELELPNEDIKLTKSGNYLLKVYPENEPGKPVITRRFQVVRNQAVIEVRIKRPTSIDHRNTHQEVDLTINTKGLDVMDPFNNLNIIITQNNRMDNAVKGLKPVFVRDEELVYDHTKDNLFAAGKEFRELDIRSLRYRSEFVKSIRANRVRNQVELYPSEVRSYKRYLYTRDINGKYVIHSNEGMNPAIESDYAYVHFTLPLRNPVAEGNIYIFGALTDWNISEANQMHYNYDSTYYEATLFLKQGYYNYMYVMAGNEEEALDLSMIEGNYYETENDYTVYIYQKSINEGYDRLVGVKQLNSLRQ